MRHHTKALAGVSGGVVLLASIPLLFVVYSAFALSTERWLGLWSIRLPDLLGNTLTLVVFVVAGCFVLGVSTAWVIARRNFPAKNLAMWLMMLPLVLPTYVFAYIYTALFEESGWLGRLWQTVFGDALAIPDIYGLGGVTFILSLSGFSYVFLMVRVSMLRVNPHLEEAAMIQGLGKRAVFWRVHLPLLRPAIAAGLAVVTLHVLSDFGAVSMLRFQTFTLSIYLQMSGRFDYEAAAGLSLILVLLGLTFLVLERFFRNRQRYFSGSNTVIYRARDAYTWEVVVIWLWLGLIACFSFILPLAWMLAWTWEGIVSGTIGAEFWTYSFNSVMLAAISACVVVVVALPVALYRARAHSWLSSVFLHLSSIGFVLPGPVVALGVLSFILAQMPLLYGGLIALIFAFMVRFLPLAVQAQDAAMSQVTPSMEEAGRILGCGPIENIMRVTLPIVKGGMVSAWVLVFIDVLKELPATLILRPVGFDTLPVRIWMEASEEMLELAAPASLMLMVGALPALWIMMRNAKTA